MSLTRRTTKKVNSGSKTAKKKILKINKKNTKEQENWKRVPLKSFKNNYFVSNYGNIKNAKTGYVLKLQIKNNYKYCSLSCKTKEQKFRVHRLVALAFVENLDWDINNIVNHIDGDKINNYYANLEWTTTKGNNKHAADNNLITKTKRRVCQYDLKGKLLKTYDTVSQAHEEANVSFGSIVGACKNNRRNGVACGFIWRYADVNPNEQCIDPEKEGFKQLKLFPNYWVSKDGRIYSKPFKKFMKQCNHNNGMEVQLSRRRDDGKKGQIKKTVRVHNIVAKYFLKKPPNQKVNCVGHKDGNHINNKVENLEWGYQTNSSTDFNF